MPRLQSRAAESKRRERIYFELHCKSAEPHCNSFERHCKSFELECISCFSFACILLLDVHVFSAEAVQETRQPVDSAPL